MTLVRVTRRDPPLVPELPAPPTPGLLSKMRTTTRTLLRHDPPASVPPPPAAPPPSRPLTHTGLYLGEAGSEQHGIWTADTFAIPVPAMRASQMRFKALHPEPLFTRQEAADPLAASPSETILRFQFGETEIASYAIEGEGDFTLELTLPAQGVAISLLDVTVSRHFTPGTVYGTDDHRRLGLLLKLVAIGGLDIIDHTARRPALPVDEMVAEVPGLNVIGYLEAELGLGEAARSCIRSARAAGITVSPVDVSFMSLHRREGGEPGEAPGDRQPISVVHVNAEHCASVLRHLADKQPALLQARRTIGFWHWEQPDFPVDYLPCFAGLQEIWTPSSFVQAAVSAISPIPVLRMPHAVTATASEGARRAAFGLPDGLFLVLVTYDFYSFQYRKNPQAAIAAYREAAGAGLAVGLVIKTINGEKVPEARDALRRDLADLANVFVIDDYLSRQAMFDLEACCDCLLSLHRAEGFGLGLAEMMCLGKPVIATNWSGNADFMTGANSMPVDYQLVPLDHDIGPYRAGSVWAEADTGQAAAHLIRLVQDPSLGKALGRRAQADMAAHYSPAAIGRLYRRRLAVLALTMDDWATPALPPAGEGRGEG